MTKEKGKAGNGVTRRQKAVYLFVAEGKNKTEIIYFQSFQRQYSDFVIKFAKAGNITDPKGLYEIAKIKWRDLELSKRNGGRAFIVLDLDNDMEKAKQVANLMKRANMQNLLSQILVLKSGFLCISPIPRSSM